MKRAQRVVPKFIGSLGLLFFLLSLGVAPSPTPVIQGLGQAYDSQGIYHSSVGPYEVKFSWKGHLVKDSDGSMYDEFKNQTSSIQVARFPTKLYKTTDEAVKALEEYLSMNGVSASRGALSNVDGEIFVREAFSYQDEWYILLVALRKGYLWQISLTADQKHYSKASRALETFTANFKWV